MLLATVYGTKFENKMTNRFSEVAERLGGTWHQIEQKGLDRFLEAYGIGWFKRSMAVKCSPTDTISITDNAITISYTAVGLISDSNTYKIGSPTKIKNPIGEIVTAVCEVNNNEIILNMTGSNAGPVMIRRYLKDNLLYVEQVCYIS